MIETQESREHEVTIDIEHQPRAATPRTSAASGKRWLALGAGLVGFLVGMLITYATPVPTAPATPPTEQVAPLALDAWLAAAAALDNQHPERGAQGALVRALLTSRSLYHGVLAHYAGQPDRIWLSSHEVYTALDGSRPTTYVVIVNTWNGDRELSTTATVSSPAARRARFGPTSTSATARGACPRTWRPARCPPVVRPAPLRHPPGVTTRRRGARANNDVARAARPIAAIRARLVRRRDAAASNDRTRSTGRQTGKNSCR